MDICGWCNSRPALLFVNGRPACQDFGSEDVSVRQYGDAAIVVAAQRQRATYQGREVPGDRFRITQVLVGRENAWLIAGLHLSPISQPPAR